MAKENKKRALEGVTPTDEAEIQRGRRQALKLGAVLVPTIITLQATPAWAQTDYTVAAYRYGTNAGKCRNPNFNPHASPNSPNGQEFIDCPSATGHDIYEIEDQSPGGGTTTPGMG